MASTKHAPTQEGLQRFGKYLISERDRLGLNQDKLCKLLNIGLTIFALGRYERAQVGKIPQEFLFALEGLRHVEKGRYTFRIYDRPLTASDCHEMICGRRPPVEPPTVDEPAQMPDLSGSPYGAAAEFLWEALAFPQSASAIAQKTAISTADVRRLLEGEPATTQQLILLTNALPQGMVVELAKMYESAKKNPPTSGKEIGGHAPMPPPPISANLRANSQKTGGVATLTKARAAEILQTRITDVRRAAKVTGIDQRRLLQLLDGDAPSELELAQLYPVLDRESAIAYVKALKD